MTTFDTALNNVRSTLGAAYAPGSGSMTLAAGGGAQFGAAFPLRVTVITQATYRTSSETLGIYQAAGIAGDTLTGTAAIEGTTDRAYSAGDIVEMRWTAGAATAIQGAVSAIETDATIVRTSNTYASPAWLTGITGAIISGNIAGNAAGITGSITEAQVTNLTSDLASKAPLASPTFTGTVTLPTGLSGVLKAAAGVVSTATAGADYLTPSGSGAALTGITGGQISGNIAGNAASITGSITTSQVSNLAAWSGSTAITTLGTIAGTLTDSTGAVAHLAGTETITGSKTWTSTFLVGDGTGNPSIEFNSAATSGGDNSGLVWKETGNRKWHLYRVQGSPYIYLRDEVNGRFQVYFTPGATANGATTTFGSTVTTDALTVTGSADVVQCIVKANATQTHHLQDWQSSGGTALAWIDANGNLYANNVSANSTSDASFAIGAASGHNSLLMWGEAGSYSWQLYKLTGNATLYMRDLVNSRMQFYCTPSTTANGATTTFSSKVTTDALTVTGSVTTAVQLTVNGPTGQSANLQSWQVNGGALEFHSRGRIDWPAHARGLGGGE